MAKQGYLEGLDDALLLISEDKLQDSVAAQVAQHTTCLKKLGERLFLKANGCQQYTAVCLSASNALFCPLPQR